mgnify:FL=1
MEKEQQMELEAALDQLEKAKDNITTKTVGHINVNAGMCWLGDPCEFVPNNDEPWHLSEHPQVKNWTLLCEQMKDVKQAKAISEGVGVIVRTGHGDGYYPVNVKTDGMGRVMSVTVEFFNYDEEET